MTWGARMGIVYVEEGLTPGAPMAAYTNAVKRNLEKVKAAAAAGDSAAAAAAANVALISAQNAQRLAARTQKPADLDAAAAAASGAAIAKDTASGNHIPSWVWIAGAAAAGMFLLRKGRRR